MEVRANCRPGPRVNAQSRKWRPGPSVDLGQEPRSPKAAKAQYGSREAPKPQSRSTEAAKPQTAARPQYENMYMSELQKGSSRENTYAGHFGAACAQMCAKHCERYGVSSNDTPRIASVRPLTQNAWNDRGAQACQLGAPESAI